MKGFDFQATALCHNVPIVLCFADFCMVNNSCYLFQVLFKEGVFLTEVNIYETYHSGGTKRIKAKDPAGKWDTIYEAQQVECHKKSRIFSPSIKV